jgi:curved DNA-binding protein CbpA
MNPYEVLGVPANATSEGITAAYRRLAKQYHPDAHIGNASNYDMATLNSAYEILSDPVKRESYDNTLHNLQYEQEEDPVEAYKREFKRKRWEKEKLEKERRLHNEKLVHRFLRFIAMPLLAIALSLLIDSLLPANVYSEKAEDGWQRRFGKGRGKTYVSYMRTHSFILAVPSQIHVNYPYYEKDKPPLIIEVSPVFNIPKQITVTLGESVYEFNA